MKRSKIFLGLTTGILAVGALVAAKASKFSQGVAAYYSDGSGLCTIGATNQFFTFQSGSSAKQATAGNVSQSLLFTYKHSPCVKALYTAGND